VAEKVQECSNYIDSRGLKEGLAFFYLSTFIRSIRPDGNQTPDTKSQQQDAIQRAKAAVST